MAVVISDSESPDLTEIWLLAESAVIYSLSVMGKNTFGNKFISLFLDLRFIASISK